MTGGKINSTELVASMINQKSDFLEGIKFAQSIIEGSASIVILKEDGRIIAARDKMGRTPLLIGKDADGHCVSFESFAYEKLGYETVKELGTGRDCGDIQRQHRYSAKARQRYENMRVSLDLLRIPQLNL